MKKYIYILLTALVATVFYSCEKDQDPIPPTFKGFTVSPKPCNSGNKVSVKLYFADKGDYIISPKLSCTLKIDTLDADGNINSATLSDSRKCSITDEYLENTFTIPETTLPKTYTCDANVEFTCSVDSKQAARRSNEIENGYEGTLKESEIRSMLYGGCSGSVNIRIVNP